MKTCKGCGSQTKAWKIDYCKECRVKNVDNCRNIAHRKAYKKRHPNGRPRTMGHLKSDWKKQGIIPTDAQIERHLSATECDCCGKDITKYRALDHDHTTGEYRGTLCRSCNLGLGSLGDDIPKVIANLQQYLQQIQLRSA
jgi:hypothetical protein